MLDGNAADVIAFESDLERRVKNLALGPKTPSNALVPLYEAIFNAIHAVQDRFGEKWVKKCQIEVELIDFAGQSPTIQIRDNGIGLNDRNFRSFRTYDSDFKLKRGGKGVGRLSWLKVFDRAEVDSTFIGDEGIQRRQFTLNLDNSGPIRQHVLGAADSDRPGTVVTLRNMKSAYATHVPTRLDTILRKLTSQFLPYLLSEEKPSITVMTDEETYDLADFLGSKEIDLGVISIADLDEDVIQLKHTLLERSIVEGKVSHKLYLAANDRVVSEQDIGLALGLTTFIEREGSRYVYAGILSGKLLDDNVNSERTAFDLDDKKLAALIRRAMGTAGEILSPQIERVVDQQAELTKSVIKKYPRFSYMVGDPKKFVEDRVPRHFRSAEQIYQQLAVFDYRENRDIERKVETLSKAADANPEAIVQEGVDGILSRLTKQEFSVLADYTVRRKVVLDLLERRLGYRPDGTMKHHAEAAMHEFIVPMRMTNQDVHVDKHNLWIIDDKLTYYEHWASDKALKKIVKGIDTNERPDVLLFGGRTTYHRPGTDQPVVIIEFKKPARDDYDDDENPFTQIYGYIDELRAGKVYDRDGGVIQEISDSTPFFCYIIADLTPKLRRWLKMAQINVPLPGGGGFYGYNDDYKAFVQALSYKYVLKDARMRNEAFFKHLSI